LNPILPMRDSVRLWDGGVYENLGMEPIYKPHRGLVDKNIRLMIVGDASAYLREHLGPAGAVTLKSLFLRPPRLFEITTEQTRALRSRMLIEAMLGGRLRGAIVRLGRSVDYVDSQARRKRPSSATDSFLDEDAVFRAATCPTNASRMTVTDFHLLLRHGFESADATLTGFLPREFQSSICWQDFKTYCPDLAS
jgi:NTE family protein